MEGSVKKKKKKKKKTDNVMNKFCSLRALQLLMPETPTEFNIKQV